MFLQGQELYYVYFFEGDEVVFEFDIWYFEEVF